MAIEDVLDAVPQLHGATEVEPLAGGLTNTNYKITTPGGCYVVRIAGKDTGLLAIDRENEAHNTLAAAETGVGAPFVAAVPDQDALVLGFLEGEVMSRDKLQRGDRIARIADACRRLHAGRRFLHDFDMFEIQRGYIQVVQERGFRLPDRYLEFEPQPAELVPAGVVPRQLLQLGVEPDRVLHHPRQRERRAQLPDEPGRVPGRAVRELVLLDEERVRPALLREVVQDGAADHAAPDDDRPRALRNHAAEYFTFGLVQL